MSRPSEDNGNLKSVCLSDVGCHVASESGGGNLPPLDREHMVVRVD